MVCDHPSLVQQNFQTHITLLLLLSLHTCFLVQPLAWPLGSKSAYLIISVLMVSAKTVTEENFACR